jgi:hypothetical protein
MNMNFEKQQAETEKLLANIIKELPRLEELWKTCSGHWHYEDPVYRFYHQSFKVFRLQDSTTAIVEAMQSLAPHLPLNTWFMEIVAQGTGKEFTMDMNNRWTEITRPIVEAFFHARFFLEMVCKYGKELQEPPQVLPSGWAAVLYLYNLR